MFDVGFSEIFLLGLIGLLVLGPERLPGVARTIGGFVRKARTSWVSLRRTIEAEMAEADLSAPIKKTREELQQIGKSLSDFSMPGITPLNHRSDVDNLDPDKIDPDGIDPVTTDTKSTDSTLPTQLTDAIDGKSKDV
jgi:sec-independent protein translocase protein TatB